MQIDRSAFRNEMACIAAAILEDFGVDSSGETSKISDFHEIKGTCAGQDYSTGVLFRLMNAIGAQPSASSVPAVPEKPAQPQKPSGNYGPVGTVSDTPVTLSYETHKPLVDYGAENSEAFKAQVDRDMYNAAVQSCKDWEESDRHLGALGRIKMNPYYNYAVFNKDRFNQIVRKTTMAIKSALLVDDHPVGSGEHYWMS